MQTASVRPLAVAAGWDWTLQLPPNLQSHPGLIDVFLFGSTRKVADKTGQNMDSLKNTAKRSERKIQHQQRCGQPALASLSINMNDLNMALRKSKITFIFLWNTRE